LIIGALMPGGLMYRGDGSQSKLSSLLHPPNE